MNDKLEDILNFLNHNYLVSYQCYENGKIEIINKMDKTEFFDTFNWCNFNEIYKRLDKKNKQLAEEYIDVDIIKGIPDSSFNINLINEINDDFNNNNVEKVNKKLNIISKDKHFMLYLEHIVELNNNELLEHVNMTLTNNYKFIKHVFNSIENRNYFNNFIKEIKRCVNESNINKSIQQIDNILNKYYLEEINKIIISSDNKSFLIKLIPTNILIKLKNINYEMLCGQIMNKNTTLTNVILNNDYEFINYFLVNLIIENNYCHNSRKISNTDNSEYILTIIAAEEYIQETNDFNILDHETGYISEWQIKQLENSVYGKYIDKLSININLKNIKEINIKINSHKYKDILTNFITTVERVNYNKNKRKFDSF